MRTEPNAGIGLNCWSKNSHSNICFEELFDNNLRLIMLIYNELCHNLSSDVNDYSENAVVGVLKRHSTVCFTDCTDLVPMFHFDL